MIKCMYIYVCMRQAYESLADACALVSLWRDCDYVSHRLIDLCDHIIGYLNPSIVSASEETQNGSNLFHISGLSYIFL